MVQPAKYVPGAGHLQTGTDEWLAYPVTLAITGVYLTLRVHLAGRGRRILR